jgi:Rps23 Pro-64 3,4-dihydroxylase Tpa1-like proline 4-hydroxylase
VDSNAVAVAQWPLAKRRKLEKAVHSVALDGFQYYYANVPIYDIYHQKQLPGNFLNQIVEFLNDPEFLDFVRLITDDESIEFADAQATRYGPGHFLTSHDDNVDGKNRRVAYVLSLSPEWRADWGGALQFFDSKGDIEHAYTPTYNALSLFRVPTNHSVGIVAPFAGAPRYSITGWLRSGPDPMG